MSTDPPNPGSHVSPRKIYQGALENLSSDHNANRSFLKCELSGKVLYDDGQVFTRLKVPAYAATLDDAYVINFAEERRGERDSLQILVDGAEKHPSTRVKREIEMYPHLSIIFDHIIRDHGTVTQRTPTGVRPATRSFVKGQDLIPEEEHHTVGFPTVNPDFTITDDGPPGDANRASDRMSRLWRHRSAFVEVKPAKDQGPKPAGSRPDTIHDLVVQSADYARLHMSSRPFLLFSVGLLIFGSQFCVGIFDRGGVVLSPVHDMWEDIKLFIAVIRSLASVDSRDLGLDPSVRLLGDEDGLRLTGIDYPAHVIDPVGADTKTRWCTVGPPLWSSISLLGRGTVVWRVRKHLEQKLSDEEFVMKTAWRSSKRDKESDIYTSVKGHCAGLAKFVTGGDVLVLVEGKTERITVRYLRRESDDAQAETPVLHRLILSPVGRPLWDYRSDTELLQGLLDALDAHEFLWKQQILHRDISAGNILLAQDANALGGAGFLHDIEFAHMPADAEISALEYVPSVTKYNDNLRPVGFTEVAVRKRTTFQTQRGAALTNFSSFRSAIALCVNCPPAALVPMLPIIQSIPQQNAEDVIHEVPGQRIVQNKSSPKFCVAICGGGIGWLTLTVALGKYSDIPIDIYEAANEIGTVGAGLAVWKRTWDVMQSIGLEAEMMKRKVPLPQEKDEPSVLVCRADDPKGGTDLYQLVSSYGAILLHRMHLVDMLRDLLPKTCTVHTSKRLSKYTHEADGSLTLSEV
ncbi:hypothetical protein EWM64_g9930 [Hericium alpestre]|uniref:Fungal-type protein kinase domain-containing protein n=1 Tax=Hericium alpestre TaxID=135208 RepID=A0A4Y9ZHH4_9AGAM|nr:hypothetical protein EWM64_g9930 [Hericium alpestre]